MKQIVVLLAPGFEECEAVVTIDILRRAGFRCESVGVAGERVPGAHGISLEADRVLGEDLEVFADYDMIVVPGGWNGVQALLADERVLTLIRSFHDRGRWVAAICAGPIVLAKAGITGGRTVTSYPGHECEKHFTDARYVEDVVARDGKIVTSRGPATALPFAFALVDLLGGDSGEVKAQFLYDDMKRWPDGRERAL